MTCVCIQQYFCISLLYFLSNLASVTSFHINHTICISSYQQKHICQIIFPSKLFVFLFFSFCRNLSVFKNIFKKAWFYPKILSYVEMYLFKIKENNEESLYISSWSNFLKTVWFVYKVMDRRTHFLHMTQNYCLKLLNQSCQGRGGVERLGAIKKRSKTQNKIKKINMEMSRKVM